MTALVERPRSSRFSRRQYPFVVLVIGSSSGVSGIANFTDIVHGRCMSLTSIFSVDANKSVILSCNDVVNAMVFTNVGIARVVVVNYFKVSHPSRCFSVASDGSVSDFITRSREVLQPFFLIWNVDRSSGKVGMKSSVLSRPSQPPSQSFSRSLRSREWRRY